MSAATPRPPAGQPPQQRGHPVLAHAAVRFGVPQRASHRIPLPSACRTSVSMTCSKTRVEGCCGGQTTHLLGRGKGTALARRLPTVVISATTQACCHPSLPPSRSRGQRWQRCPACAVPGPPRMPAPGLGGSAAAAESRLLVISTSERSLHCSKEENRMQEITSQLG